MGSAGNKNSQPENIHFSFLLLVCLKAPHSCCDLPTAATQLSFVMCSSEIHPIQNLQEFQAFSARWKCVWKLPWRFGLLNITLEVFCAGFSSSNQIYLLLESAISSSSVLEGLWHHRTHFPTQEKPSCIFLVDVLKAQQKLWRIYPQTKIKNNAEFNFPHH